jgi:4-amino-4-deoxy-L-arabinose transferase-like glycosyltransferase
MRLKKTVLLSILATHSAMLGFGAYIHSPTLNEPGHLIAGLGSWQLGRFDLYIVNPPLVRMIAAAPAFFLRANTDWQRLPALQPGVRPELVMGEDFVAANGYQAFWYFTFARWALIPFSLLGGYICYRWANELYGTAAGFVALSLWCFCPNVLGHAQLATNDIASASLDVTATYLFWHWLKDSRWSVVAFCGVALGLAELTKMTLLVLFLLWPALWLFSRLKNRRDLSIQHMVREAAMLLAMIAISVYVLNLGYAFEGTLTKLGDFQFVSDSFRGTHSEESGSSETNNRWKGTWFANLPVPLPTSYLLGIDLEKRDFEHYYEPSYLNGEFRERGWWYYYLYSVAIKVPLGTSALACLAIFVRLRWGRINGYDDIILLASAATIVVVVSSQTGFSEHFRYVLPAFPFAFIWISQSAVLFCRSYRVACILAMLSLGWSVGSSILVYPHSLSFFNELGGGPIGGSYHLIHSNIDWGQDLLLLKRWLDDHPEVNDLHLAYFGGVDPRFAGISYRSPENIPSVEEVERGQRMPTGWYAISVNFVRGLPYFTYRGDGTRVDLAKNQFAAFQQLTPTHMIGYSIWIFHISDGSSPASIK